MKRIVAFFLASALLLSAMGAFAAQFSPEDAAKAVVPADAQMLSTTKDDGMTVVHFRMPDNSRYEVDVDPVSGSVVRVEYEAASTRGSSSAVLTEQQAQEALLALYPGASVDLVHLERDDGRYSYELHFITDAFAGWAELNAETGALLEADLDYTEAARVQAQGPLTAEQAKELVLSLVPGSRLVEFETEREDGRTEYEGELRADDASYEFTIDAETGRIIEWEMER